MKKFLFALLFLVFVLQAFSQSEKNPVLAKDYYLQKSRNQKTAGWILLGGGTALMAGGLIIASRDLFGTAGDIGGVMLLGGIVADIISIPVFISAHKNEIRAATVAITNQKILWYQKNSVGFITQPSVTIKIPL